LSRETLRLLRESPSFARLWLAEVISLGGDWFTLIALAILISRATSGSGLAVSSLLVTQLLPAAALGPFSGVLVDRFDRRRLLILSDVARVAIVLLFIPAAGSGHLGFVYVLAFLHFSVATVFEPGRSALLPSLVKETDLVRASTLSSVTWSVMAALGGLAGGAVLSAIGVRAAFAVDALSFLVSATLIASIPGAEASPAEAQGKVGVRAADGFRFIRDFPVPGAAAFVKAINGVAPVDTFMVLYASRLFAGADNGARSLGLLYAAFGVGAILGPLLFNRINDGAPRTMRRFVSGGSALLTCGLLVLSGAPSLALAALAILLRGMGGSINWTFSTILLQKTVPDALRGRLFAIELAASHTAFIAFSLTWGYAVDHLGLRPVVLLAAAFSMLPGLAWTASLRWMDRREARAGGVD
jgi:NRE family putative nickel resistance protein-like MFS transporter